LEPRSGRSGPVTGAREYFPRVGLSRGRRLFHAVVASGLPPAERLSSVVLAPHRRADNTTDERPEVPGKGDRRPGRGHAPGVRGPFPPSGGAALLLYTFCPQRRSPCGRHLVLPRLRHVRGTGSFSRAISPLRSFSSFQHMCSFFRMMLQVHSSLQNSHFSRATRFRLGGCGLEP
jgi:hypothetical protein